MGLLSDSPLRRTAEDVVWCYDTSVKVPDHLIGAGWISASEVVLDKGADVVRIRALDDDGKARVDGLMEEHGAGVLRAAAAGAPAGRRERQQQARRDPRDVAVARVARAA
jgi:hypothetical protein